MLDISARGLPCLSSPIFKPKLLTYKALAELLILFSEGPHNATCTSAGAASEFSQVLAMAADVLLGSNSEEIYAAVS